MFALIKTNILNRNLSFQLLAAVVYCTFYSLVASAQPNEGGFDFSVSTNYRTFPKSGSVELDLGYGRVWWGSPQTPFYGFYRVSLNPEGVEDYFSGQLQLEIFPVSFLGIRFARSWIQNHLDYKDYDCITFICRGYFEADKLEVPLYLKFKSILLFSAFRKSFWNYKSLNSAGTLTEFIEPTSGLPLDLAQTSHITQWQGGVFWQASASWRLGYIEASFINKDNSVRATNHSRQWFGVIQKSISESSRTDLFKITLGAGEYSSNISSMAKRNEPTLYLSLTYSPYPKLGY